MERLAGRGRNHASQVIYGRLGSDVHSPEFETAYQTVRGLEAWGMVETVETEGTALKVIKVTKKRKVLTEPAAALARAQPLEPVRQLLDSCERGRPQVWKLLRDGIEDAFRRRTEPDSGDWGSSPD